MIAKQDLHDCLYCCTLISKFIILLKGFFVQLLTIGTDSFKFCSLFNEMLLINSLFGSRTKTGLYKLFHASNFEKVAKSCT